MRTAYLVANIAPAADGSLTCKGVGIFSERDPTVTHQSANAVLWEIERDDYQAASDAMVAFVADYMPWVFPDEI